MSVAPGLQPESWHLLSLLDRAPGLQVLADTLTDLADRGEPVLVGSADLKYSNGLVRFQERHPDKYIQFGISEQHMISTAAGLATTGYKPYVATFASFLSLLALEQVRTDVAYTKQPVRLIGHHAGMTLGFYGTSHHALEDLAIMRTVADLTVIAPADTAQLRAAILASVEHPEPIYFRIGRGQDPDVYDDGHPYEIGRAIEHGRGTDATIIATGSMVHPSLEAAARLNATGISTGVLDMHTIKPLDLDAIVEAADRSSVIVTVEEHNITGGLGGAVAEVMASSGAPARLARHGVRDEYVLIGPPTHLYAHYGLDAHGVERFTRQALA